jgi:hypothetical protein
MKRAKDSAMPTNGIADPERRQSFTRATPAMDSMDSLLKLVPDIARIKIGVF